MRLKRSYLHLHQPLPPAAPNVKRGRHLANEERLLWHGNCNDWEVLIAEGERGIMRQCVSAHGNEDIHGHSKPRPNPY